MSNSVFNEGDLESQVAALNTQIANVFLKTTATANTTVATASGESKTYTFTETGLYRFIADSVNSHTSAIYNSNQTGAILSASGNNGKQCVIPVAAGTTISLVSSNSDSPATIQKIF